MSRDTGTSRRPGWFTRLYGANILHLVALLGCFALAGYSVSFVVAEPLFTLMLLWFGAAVVAHDLVLFPSCALIDRVLTAMGRVSWVARRTDVRWINHVRIPVLGSGLLFLMFFPGIIQQGTETHVQATGQDQQPYFDRWLTITAAFVAVSAAVYLTRLVRALYIRKRDRAAESADAGEEGG